MGQGIPIGGIGPTFGSSGIIIGPSVYPLQLIAIQAEDTGGSGSDQVRVVNSTIGGIAPAGMSDGDMPNYKLTVDSGSGIIWAVISIDPGGDTGGGGGGGGAGSGTGLGSTGGLGSSGGLSDNGGISGANGLSGANGVTGAVGGLSDGGGLQGGSGLSGASGLS